MATNPRITIGLPFHNAESTLLDSIRSIFAQTFQSWELILYDDGSTDGSLAIAQSISDDRVRVLSEARNRGLVAALNRIPHLARGEYLARMDADDLMHPDRLARQVEFLDRHPQACIVGTGAYVIDGAGRPIGIRGQMPPDMSDYGLLRVNPVLHPTVTGRTAWFQANPYDPAFPRSEDHELWCRIAGRTRLEHLNHPLMFIRNANLRQTGKYAASCRSDVLIYRKYGPARIGHWRTARLVAQARVKPLVYSLAVRAGVEAKVLAMRNQPLTVEQAAEAIATLEYIAQVPLHVILQSFQL